MFKSIKASFIMATAFSVAAALKIETFEEYSNDKNYRKQLTMDYVERLRYHIFSHIPYSLIDDVKNKVGGSFVHHFDWLVVTLI